MVPQSVRELLEVLERIEKANPANKVVDRPKGAAKSGDSSKRKMVTFSDQIPQRRHTEMHCSLCKKHGVCIPPITLRIVGCMSPTGPPRRPSRGQRSADPLVDLRDLLKEEVALCNYPLKLTH